MTRLAEFSKCGRFRHVIMERWDARPAAVFLQANPSIASAERPDPTWTKSRGFAERLGYGGVAIVNVFDYIATYPKDLAFAGYPRSQANDAWILTTAAAQGDGSVICAWGAVLRGRPEPLQTAQMLRNARFRTMALGFTEQGEPRHTLMLPYNTRLVPFHA